MMQHEVAYEGETGKCYRANFYDRFGRTVLISRPAMQVFHYNNVLATMQNQYHLYLNICIMNSHMIKCSETQKNDLFFPSNFQNTNSPEDNVRHVVYTLENSILNLHNGQEQISWLIDFTGFTLNTNISVKAARGIINIMQNHYPERLAISFLYNPPKFFQAFWKVKLFPLKFQSLNSHF